MTLTKEEIKNWLSIFQAFFDDNKEILTSRLAMYPKESVDENDIDSEYIDSDKNIWVTKKSDWIPINKDFGLTMIRSNFTIINPKEFYRVVDKKNKGE